MSLKGISNTIQNINTGIFNITPGRYCTEVENVISYAKKMGYLLPTSFQLRCLDSYVTELKKAGIWSTLDMLYIFGYNSSYGGRPVTAEFSTNDSQRLKFEEFTFINLKNTSQFNLTLVKDGTRPQNPNYTNLGYKNTGTAGEGSLETGWIAGTNSINWTQNNASFSLYLANFNDEATTNLSRSVCGVRDAANNRTPFRFNPWIATSNDMGFQINTTGTRISVGSGISTAIGYYHVERTASNLTTCYRNGTSYFTATSASATMISNLSARLLVGNTEARWGGTGNGPPLAMFKLGSSLGSTLQKKDYEIFNSFITKLGYK